jgi:hypothetical protein
LKMNCAEITDGLSGSVGGGLIPSRVLN